MSYKVRTEELDSGTTEIYIRDEEGYLRLDGELPRLARQLLRTGEKPIPTFAISTEMATALAEAIKPQTESADNNALQMLRTLHEYDREDITFMRMVIAKLIGMQANEAEEE